MNKTLENTNEQYVSEINALEQARSLAELAQQVPTILDEIAPLEQEIAPTVAELKAKKATLKQFMVDAELERFDTDNGFVLKLVNKVRKNLNVDLVQKAVSKTMWDRITKYVDPNGGKKPKQAYTESSFPSLTIERPKIEVDTDIEVGVA